MHVCATEREKKLSFDLKKEVSGDFSKALLLLAEVCQRLLLLTFPSYLSCDTHQSKRLVTDVLLNLGDVVKFMNLTGFS